MSNLQPDSLTMKLRLHSHKGFTLIEILVVIAIMAALSVASWGAYGMIENRKLNQQAQLEVEKMAAALVAFNSDGYDFPWGKGDELSSNTLYTTLTFDYNNDGTPDPGKKGEVRVPYCTELMPVDPNSDMQMEGIPCYKVKLAGAGQELFAVIDPWGRPYRYRLGYEQTFSFKGDKAAGKGSKKTIPGQGINPDFDIFSLGPDGEGDCKTKDGNGNDDNVSNIKLW